MADFQPKKFTSFVPVIAAIIAAFMVILISVKYGLAMSPDSACYLSIAENLLKGNGFALYDFTPAVHWPPLYPLALAFGGLFNYEISGWARILNTLLYGLIVYFSSRWIIDKVENRVLGIVGVLAVLCSMSLYYVAKNVWSETLFVFLTILFLIRLEKSVPHHTLKDVLILSALAALACLTKYLGVALVFSYLLGLLFLKTNLKQKFINALIFSAISLTPLLIWIWRNYLVSGTLAGRRAGSSASLLKNFLLSIDSISIWFVPQKISPYIRISVVGALIILLIIWYLKRNWNKIKSEGLPPLLWVNGGFMAVYLAYLLAISSLVAFDSIDQRFTVHIYIPMVVSLIFVIDQMIKNTTLTRILLKGVGIVLTVLWIFYMNYQNIIEIKYCLRHGAGGFSHYKWRDLKLTEYLSEFPIPGKIYSNFPDGVYVLSGRPAFMSPRKHFHREPNQPTDDMKQLTAELEKVHIVYLAWFAKQGRDFLYTPEELMPFFDLKQIAVLHEDILYQISNSNSPALP